MPLGILLPMVVIGIAAIAGMLHLLGYSRTALIAGEDAALVLWRRHWPGVEPLGALVADDGHAALIRTERGPGLVWSFGADTTARLLSGARSTPCKAGLRFDLHDFTAPHVVLHLREAEARDWLDRIERHAA